MLYKLDGPRQRFLKRLQVAILRNASWAMLILALLVTQRELIEREERYLERTFGEVPGPTEGGVPLVSDGYIKYGGLGGASRCQFERTLRGEFCGEDGAVIQGGLRLCARHAERLLLEERQNYWRAVLAHVELWSGEARSRSRGDVVRLLGAEREKASAELARASERLEELGGSRRGEDGWRWQGSVPWPSLLLLGLLGLLPLGIGVGGRPP